MKKNISPKRKMQDVSFSGIEEFLDYLPDDERRIVTRLRQIVVTALPDCQEKLSYNVPFYKRRSNICFIWPGSVPWGKSYQKGVRFGFTKGYLLEDAAGFLEKGNRKQVYWHDYFSLKDIDGDLLQAYLYEAAILDEQTALKKVSIQKRSQTLSQKN